MKTKKIIKRKRKTNKSKKKKVQKQPQYTRALSVNCSQNLDNVSSLQKSFDFTKDPCPSAKVKTTRDSKTGFIEDDFGYGENGNQSFISMDLELEEEREKNFVKRTKIYLLKSIYKGRPKTAYFPYPTCCQLEHDDYMKSRVIDPVQTGQKVPKMTFKYPGNGFNNCRNVCAMAGLKQTFDKDWNLL